MRSFLPLLFVFISFVTFCQPQEIQGKITYGEFLGDYRGLFILLNHGGSTIYSTMPDSTGNFSFRNVNRGFYSVVIKETGRRKDFLADSLLVVTDKPVSLTFTYPPPCQLVHIKGQKPLCPKDHSDKIIPIVYGFPTTRTMEKAKKGLVRLGGCIVSRCDPRYYCTIHDLEF